MMDTEPMPCPSMPPAPLHHRSAGRNGVHHREGAVSPDVEADGGTVDLNSLPVESPVPDHLDGGKAVLELEVDDGVLLGS